MVRIKQCVPASNAALATSLRYSNPAGPSPTTVISGSIDKGEDGSSPSLLDTFSHRSRRPDLRVQPP